MEWLKISTSTELVRVQTEDIAFIAADGNYSDLYLANGETRKLTFQLHFFEDSLKKLSEKSFVRVGRSIIVNKNYVHVINLGNQRLTLSGNHLKKDYELSVSKEALRQLKETLEKEGKR